MDGSPSDAHPAEARLAEASAGKAAEGEGWFVVNVAEAAGVRTERFGSGVRFEGSIRFEGFGINVRVLEPGRPASLYHRENAQEACLVLSGEALLIVGSEQRPLEKGDFVHLPAGTPHVIVGAGSGPAAVLMVGERPADHDFSFEPNDAAARYGGAVERATGDFAAAYGRVGAEPATIGLPW